MVKVRLRPFCKRDSFLGFDGFVWVAFGFVSALSGFVWHIFGFAVLIRWVYGFVSGVFGLVWVYFGFAAFVWVVSKQYN